MNNLFGKTLAVMLIVLGSELLLETSTLAEESSISEQTTASSTPVVEQVRSQPVGRDENREQEDKADKADKADKEKLALSKPLPLSLSTFDENTHPALGNPLDSESSQQSTVQKPMPLVSQLTADGDDKKDKQDNKYEKASEEVTPSNPSSLFLPSLDEYTNPDLGNSVDPESSEETTSMEQVTSVTQLTDVRPTDWAFEALRSLVERYGCIAGYPDGTYRGNRSMTRYEFAAGLNACLNQIERLISTATSEFVTKEDLLTLQRLQEEFKTELASLGTRVDTLEGRVASLEERQFSTTTKLNGRVEIGLTSAFRSKKAVPSGQIPSEDLDSIPVMGGTAILTLDTSFTGKDSLSTTLLAGNLDPFASDVTGTSMTSLAFGLKTLGGLDRNTGGDLILGSLSYSFPLSDRGKAVIGLAGTSFDSFMTNINYAETISVFGIGNPIKLLGSGAGAGFEYQLSDAIKFGAGYIASSANDPSPGAGLFNGQYGALAQLLVSPSKSFDIALIYAHTYSPEPGGTVSVTGFTGSQFAQFPFGESTATSANAFSLEAGWQITEQIGVGVWGGYISARAESSPQVNGLNASRGADADIWYWATGLEIKDLVREGSELGLVFGVPPKLTRNDVPGRRDRDTAYHIEAYYSFPLTAARNLFLTPGIVGILNPEHNKENDNIWIGTVVFSLYF